MLISAIAFAQPANDNCSGATALTLGSGTSCTPSSTISWTNATASSGPPAPGCGSYSTGDIWFSFTIPSGSNQDIFITTTAGTITDGAMALYSGSCATTLISCDDDSGAGSMPQISRTNMAPGTYYIRFWEYYDATSGSIGGICVVGNPTGAPPPAPANDDCSGATALTLGSGSTCTPSTTLSWSGATASVGPPDPGCAAYTTGTTADVWFKYTIPSGSNQDIFITSTSGTITDGGMALYSGSCATTLISCDDDTGAGSMPQITSTNMAPGTYYIRFWDYGGSASGSIGGICVVGTTSAPPPANDNCSTATVLTPASSCSPTSYTTIGATNSNVTPTGSCSSNSGTPDDDVWFSFMAANTTQNLTLANTSGNTDIYFQVFSSS
ncbi:MAG: hypothetical protein KBA06_03620, partial [Saprospiraceae bacterium]|nr:hypothetical protein [Saprospiraceae bacterium]